MSIPLTTSTYVINIGGAPVTNETLDCDVEVAMNTSFTPDMFQIKIYNIDTIIQRFVKKGNTVTIVLGYENALRSNIIIGTITNIMNRDSEGETITIVDGIDNTIYKLKTTKINLSLNYPKDVIEIIRDISFQCGVTLSIDSVLSGILLENYTIENEFGYDCIEKLVNRIGYNATAKNGTLIVTPTISSGIISSAITELAGFNVTKNEGLTQDGLGEASGFDFLGAGLPTLRPMRAVIVQTEEINGTFIIETVIHKYSVKEGYKCMGTLIESGSDIHSTKAVQYPSPKALSSRISDKIAKEFDKLRTIDTSKIEQLFSTERTATMSIGKDKNKNKSSVTPSTEAEIGVNDVFLIKKPLSSIFAGDGFGLVVPVYKDMQGIVGFNDKDMQDANLLGFLWKKGWTIPDHDEGDFMLHLLNHSKMVFKEDGHCIFQVRGLNIEIGDNGLVAVKPSPTDNGKLLIQFDDGSYISYKDGEGWVLDGATIKLGENADKGVARLDDTTISNSTIESTFWTWLLGFIAVFQSWVPVPTDGGLALKTALTAFLGTNPTPTSLQSKINQASTIVKGE